MPVTLLASACPAPKNRTSLKTIAAANNNTGSGVASAKTYVTGMTQTEFAPRFNQNACLSELLGAYGGGAYAVIQGLAITAGSGLTLNIAAGQALIDGVVEKTASTLALLDNTARLWIWVAQDGTLSYTTTTTAPSAVCVLLGSAVTSGGSITSVDSSGVLYLRGGIAYRETADVAAPTDTPASTLIHLCKTLANTYLWNGFRYLLLDEGFPSNVDNVADGVTSVVADGRQTAIFDSLSIYGVVYNYGKVRVI